MAEFSETDLNKLRLLYENVPILTDKLAVVRLKDDMCFSVSKKNGAMVKSRKFEIHTGEENISFEEEITDKIITASLYGNEMSTSGMVEYTKRIGAIHIEAGLIVPFNYTHIEKIEGIRGILVASSVDSNDIEVVKTDGTPITNRNTSSWGHVCIHKCENNRTIIVVRCKEYDKWRQFVINNTGKIIMSSDMKRNEKIHEMYNCRIMQSSDNDYVVCCRHTDRVQYSRTDYYVLNLDGKHVKWLEGGVLRTISLEVDEEEFTICDQQIEGQEHKAKERIKLTYNTPTDEIGIPLEHIVKEYKI